jgi:hypothetical protein
MRRYSMNRERIIEALTRAAGSIDNLDPGDLDEECVNARAAAKDLRELAVELQAEADYEELFTREQERGERLADEMRWIADWAGNESPIRQTIDAVMGYADWARDTWRSNEPE